MPVEFVHDVNDVKKAYKLVMAYDGSGHRISKTRLRRDLGASDWAVENVTHYTGIGTEVRETHVNGQDETKVVVNMPQGLGRYMPEDAEKTALSTTATLDENGRPTSWSVINPKFEWYLKNHLGSTMMVYGTGSDASENGVKAAYDYRAFGEQVTFTEPTDKVTENFTGKEKDDETDLNYFGARYLDPMLGMWTSVDPKRQFSSPYLYVGNGVNPVNGVDPDGNQYQDAKKTYQSMQDAYEKNNQLEQAFMGDNVEKMYEAYEGYNRSVANVGNSAGKAAVKIVGNATPGGVFNPIKGTIKRSIKEEVNEDEKETGSKLESLKNVVGKIVGTIKDLLWGPTASETTIPEDQ